MNIKDMPRMWDEENKKMYYPMPFDGTVRYVLASDIKESLGLDDVFIIEETGFRYAFDRPAGLSDKYGNTIYEGDIIRNEEGTEYTINWNEYGYWQADTFALAMCASALYDRYEVVGNIHQGVKK